MKRKQKKRKLKTVDVVIQKVLTDKTYSKYTVKQLEERIQRLLK